MTQLKLRFKAKPKNGMIRVPNFTPAHVTGPEHFNDLALRIELRRAYNNDPKKRLPSLLDINDLPPNVRILNQGFLVEFEVTI